MASTTKRHPGTVSFVRYKLGLSQQQLADTLGVSRSLIAMVETGKRKLPGTVHSFYLAMCEGAAAVNPEGYISVKRGRKPSRADFSFVTNCDNHTAQSTDDGFIAKLQETKKLLDYLQTGLQFKRKAMEEQALRISGQLTVFTAKLKVSTELLDKLPEGKLRDKYELNAAIFYARQVKLRQQFKKYGPVATLQTEYQLNKLERQVSLVEETIAGSVIRYKVPVNDWVPAGTGSPGKNFITGMMEKDLQYGRDGVIAA